MVKSQKENGKTLMIVTSTWKHRSLSSLKISFFSFQVVIYDCSINWVENALLFTYGYLVDKAWIQASWSSWCFPYTIFLKCLYYCHNRQPYKITLIWLVEKDFEESTITVVDPQNAQEYRCDVNCWLQATNKLAYPCKKVQTQTNRTGINQYFWGFHKIYRVFVLQILLCIFTANR